MHLDGALGQHGQAVAPHAVLAHGVHQLGSRQAVGHGGVADHAVHNRAVGVIKADAGVARLGDDILLGFHVRQAEGDDRVHILVDEVEELVAQVLLVFVDNFHQVPTAMGAFQAKLLQNALDGLELRPVGNKADGQIAIFLHPRARIVVKRGILFRRGNRRHAQQHDQSQQKTQKTLCKFHVLPPYTLFAMGHRLSPWPTMHPRALRRKKTPHFSDTEACRLKAAFPGAARRRAP